MTANEAGDRDPRAHECGVGSIERWLRECLALVREAPTLSASNVIDRIENALDALSNVRRSGAEICDELDAANAEIKKLKSRTEELLLQLDQATKPTGETGPYMQAVFPPAGHAKLISGLGKHEILHPTVMRSIHDDAANACPRAADAIVCLIWNEAITANRAAHFERSMVAADAGIERGGGL